MQESLHAHNEFRANHGAAPLAWSDECYNFAWQQAEYCSASGGLSHGNLIGPSGIHGQNAYWNSGGVATARQAVESWYSEVHKPGYQFGTNSKQYGTGHFTQVVWAGSRYVGVAISADGCYVVANYLPAGNVADEYVNNVLPPAAKQSRFNPWDAARRLVPTTQNQTSVKPSPLQVSRAIAGSHWNSSSPSHRPPVVSHWSSSSPSHNPQALTSTRERQTQPSRNNFSVSDGGGFSSCFRRFCAWLSGLSDARDVEGVNLAQFQSFSRGDRVLLRGGYQLRPGFVVWIDGAVVGVHCDGDPDELVITTPISQVSHLGRA